MAQVARYHGEVEWIELRLASAPTIFTGSGPQRLLPVCRSQKNAPRKEILLQGTLHVSTPKRTLISRPKINRFTRKVLKCYRSAGLIVLLLKETMLMNKVEFCQKNVFFLVSPGTYWSTCYMKDNTFFHLKSEWVLLSITNEATKFHPFNAFVS